MKPSAFSRPGSPREVHIAIDRLSLHGFPPGDGRRVVRALEAELARLANDAGGDIARPDRDPRGPVHYGLSRDPEETGRAAARALWSRATGLEGEPS